MGDVNGAEGGETAARVHARGQRSLFNSFRRIGDGTLINIIYDINSAAKYRFVMILLHRESSPCVFVVVIEI